MNCNVRNTKRTLRAQSSCGAVIAEFLVVVPLFFLFLGGIMNFSAYLYEMQALAEAAHIGSRAAAGIQLPITPMNASTAVINTINNYLGSAGLNKDNYTININDVASPGAGIPKSLKITVGRKTAPVLASFAKFKLKNRCPSSTSMIDSEVAFNPQTTAIPGC